MEKSITAFLFVLLLGGCLCLCSCGREMEAVEESSEDASAPLEWEDVLKPDGTVDQDKWNEYWGISVPEQDALEDVAENVILLGATAYDYQYIYKEVNSFNQAQSDYTVEVKKYESSDGMFLDLVRGRGCDLLALSPLYLEMLSDKGGLEDLSPYLEESEKVGREDLFDAVLEAGTAGGRLAGILPGFKMQAILVEKGYTEDGGWTIEEYLALMDKHPDVPLSSNSVGPNAFVLWMPCELSALAESFVDWEERTCSFESDAFIQTIEMLKGYMERCQKMDVDSSGGFNERFFRGQVQTLLVEVDYDEYFAAYVDLRDAFLDSYELAGLPNQEGEARYPMPMYFDKTVMYSMNAASAKKDAAWLFLEYMLSDYQEKMTEVGMRREFPARRSIVERLLQEEVEAEVTENYMVRNYYTNEMAPKRGTFTEEDKENLLYLLEHAAPPTALQIGSSLKSILLEELGSFFEGDKTAAEAAHIIQNRMTIYLNE